MTDTIFKPGQEYRTRDGRRARVYATDGVGHDAIHGAYFTTGFGWSLIAWDALGANLAGTDFDLMPPEPEKERVLLWVTPKHGTDKEIMLEVEIQPDGVLKAVR